jgi:competence protein ComEC
MNPHFTLFSKYPLVQFAVPFCLGICAAEYVPYPAIASLGCALVALIALLRDQLRLAGCALLIALFFAGAIQQRQPQRQLIPTGRSLVLTGVLNGPPEFARDRVYLNLKVEQGFEGSVSLLCPGNDYRSLNLRYGARIRVTTTLTRADNYRNPGVSPLSEYLERRGYVATGVIRNARSIVRLEDTRVFPVLAWLYEWRDRLQREIDARFDPETAGVLDAALLGNRHNLSNSASERFREGGTFHVLVISGLHITFIGGVVLLVVRRLTNRRMIQFVVPAVIVWCYSVAVGAEASVVRAALMFTFVGFGAVLFRPATSLNALGAAALVLLVHNKKEIFDPSFQLTFLSVLAIVAIAWPLLQKLSAIGSWYPTSDSPYPPNCSRGLRTFCELLFWSDRHWRREMARSTHRYRVFKTPLAAFLERYQIQRCLRYVFGAVVVSAAVQIVLLPQMILYFHRLSLSSLLLNIVVSVLLAVLAAIALLALLVVQVSAPVAAPLFKLAGAIDWLMVHSVDPFTSLGVASLRLPEYTGWPRIVYVLYYVPLLLLVIALDRWQPLARVSFKRDCRVLPLAVVQCGFLIVLILHPFSAARTKAQLRIDFLDVGQGDAALITTPNGTTLLVDGGGRPFERASRSIGEAVVSEYLWWRGLDRVDYVLATHADADHIDGLNDVVRNFAVNSALAGRTPSHDPELAKFSKSLIKTNLQTIQAGDVMRFGEVEIRVLWPPPGSESTNDDSVVLKLKFRDRSILLTGDIEKKTEAALSTQDLQADVVKVAHHGSRTSSTEPFVSKTNPRFAIISVGRDSMFGHPHPEVVQRWKATGAEVLTTGECGTITVTTDGKDLWLERFIEK